MKDRKSALLSAIIKEHILTGTAVASKAIVDKHAFSVSPATVRNDMSELEEEGFIQQPHTSAGRIPTEKGWKYYIENFIKDIKLTKAQQREIGDALRQANQSYESAVKSVAKSLAELSREAVFVGFGADSFYYTGLSNLVRQPEFQRLDLVYHISGIVDHMDDVIKKIVINLDKHVSIKIGSDNPFGTECSSIVARYQCKGDQQGILGILGPMRMDYETNLALLKHAQELFTEI
ncbi:MAG: DeoR family transcriptional regulator [Patescibacteria group bacterium]|nr:DeoR family transcriptional regulator [Patescibacteria group bacterium]MDD5715311.1 DeoR family transcriptional regulator [Patescibacteria group bacterium]